VAGGGGADAAGITTLLQWKNVRVPLVD